MQRIQEGGPQGMVMTQRTVAQGSISQSILFCNLHQVAHFFLASQEYSWHCTAYGEGPVTGLRAFAGQTGKRELHSPRASPACFHLEEGRAQLSSERTSAHPCQKILQLALGPQETREMGIEVFYEFSHFDTYQEPVGSLLNNSQDSPPVTTEFPGTLPSR